MKQKTAKKRVVLRSILILGIAFAVYALIVSYVVYNNIKEDNYESVSVMIDTNIDGIEQTFDMLTGTMIAISGSESVSSWRANQSFFIGDGREVQSNIEYLNKEVQRILVYNNAWYFDQFDYVAIYEDDKLLTYTYTKPLSPNQIVHASNSVRELIKDSEDYSMTIAPSMTSPMLFTTLRVRTDFTNGKSLYLIGATNVSLLNDKLSSMVSMKGVDIYIVNKEGMIYASTRSGMHGQRAPEDICNLSYGKEMRESKIDSINYVATRRAVNNEFDIIYLLPKKELMKQTISGMKSFIFLSIAVAFVLILLASFIQVRYENRLLQNEMELRFLQQQMNPHFLFNILLTIQIKAKMSGDEVVYRMITSLAKLLRAGIYKDKRSIISIREELQYVEYYLSLQKERFEEKLEYQINADESLLDSEIPRLVIEPIVENAVVHGMESLDGNAFLRVHLIKEAGDIIVYVQDNGVGFDPSEMKKTDSDHIGIENTNQRLKLIYGDNYGLTVHSVIGEGTRVQIRIPNKRLVSSYDTSDDR